LITNVFRARSTTDSGEVVPNKQGKTVLPYGKSVGERKKFFFIATSVLAIESDMVGYPALLMFL
jgi:hypothetical protein